MAKSVKLGDIAAIVGVSTVTVSTALSDQKGVSEELRAQIKQLADEMGYQSPSEIRKKTAKKKPSTPAYSPTCTRQNCRRRTKRRTRTKLTNLKTTKKGPPDLFVVCLATKKTCDR